MTLLRHPVRFVFKGWSSSSKLEDMTQRRGPHVVKSQGSDLNPDHPLGGRLPLHTGSEI